MIMRKRIIASFAALLAVAGMLSAQQWAPAGDRIKTKWADEVSPTNAHPEYPRPQMVRQDWQSLNGLWDYAITPKSQPCPRSFDGKILVPFAIESSLSGVGRTFTADDALWYKTTFSVPSAWKGKRLMLNFEAVDWKAEVFVNDIKIGSHTGGYTHFEFLEYSSEYEHLREQKEFETMNRAENVIQLHREGKTYREIADLVGLSKSMIGKIIKKSESASTDGQVDKVDEVDKVDSGGQTLFDEKKD